MAGDSSSKATWKSDLANPVILQLSQPSGLENEKPRLQKNKIAAAQVSTFYSLKHNQLFKFLIFKLRSCNHYSVPVIAFRDG